MSKPEKVDIFSHSMLDRRGIERIDPDLVEKRFRSGNSRTLVWLEQGFIMEKQQPWYYRFKELPVETSAIRKQVYLGRHQNDDYFVIQPDSSVIKNDLNNQVMSLRQAGLLVSEFDLELMFYAQGMLNWLNRQQFCGYCGQPNDIADAGHVMKCVNPDCGKTHYPKLDPAVIFSLVNEQQTSHRILLARKPEWEARRRAVIAGFIEPGETLENAVRREALEETGLRVSNIDYIASQPWPFPDALMLGFHATTCDEQITLHDQELAQADWFTALEIEQGIKQGTLMMPYAASLAWELIDCWFRSQTGYSTRNIKQV